MTPQDFFDKYNGKAIDYDGAYGVQCVDAWRIFCTWAGVPSLPTPNNYADGYWYSRDALGYAKHFDYITDVSQLRDGDWCFWAKGSSHKSSHAAMYFRGQEFGQNQGGNRQFLAKSTTWDILGALRFRGWDQEEVMPMKIKTGYSIITYQGLRLHCYKMDPETEEIRLYSLNHPSLYKLSGIRADGIDMHAKKNASFFVMNTGYVNGSEVSDIYDEAVPEAQGYIDVAQLKDGTWKFGNFGVYDYRKKDVNLRYSTGLCLIAGGVYSDEYSTGCGKYIQEAQRTLSLLGIDWSNNPIFIVMEPSQTATPYVLREFGMAVGLQYLFRDDGGGSAELCVNGKIVNGVTSERALPNCLAIIKKQVATEMPETPETPEVTEPETPPVTPSEPEAPSESGDNGTGGTDTTDTMTQINYQGGSNSLSNISTAFHVYAKTGTVPKMTVSKSTFNGSNITAVQIALDSNCQFINSYNPDGTTVKDAENNTYMTSHGYYCVASCNGGYFEATGDNRFKPVGAVMTDWNGKWSQYKGEDCVPGYQNGYPSLCYDDGKVYLVDLNADGFDLSKYHWINGVGQSEVIDYKVNCNVGYANGRYSQQNNTLSIGYDSKTNTVTFMINTASGLDTLNKAYVMQGLGCELATQLDGGISACLRYRADLVGQNTGNTDNQGDTTDLDAQISQLQTDIDTLTTERNNYKAKITNALNDLK